MTVRRVIIFSEKEENTMTEKYSDDRRSFLKTVALLSWAAVCLPLAKEAAASRKPSESLEKSGQGYRETEHISKYYKAARI